MGLKEREEKRRNSVVAAMISDEAKQEHNTTNIHNTHTHTHTQQAYTSQREEMRNKRVQFVIKPSVNEKLDELAKSGAIKSKNDLVNFLLESYIAQLEG